MAGRRAQLFGSLKVVKRPLLSGQVAHASIGKRRVLVGICISLERFEVKQRRRSDGTAERISALQLRF
jgi:hypothetical protein